ncbi:MAG: septal ring lytic transglycosylase RlpA family protein [Pseudomonadota bacterium]
MRLVALVLVVHALAACSGTMNEAAAPQGGSAVPDTGDTTTQEPEQTADIVSDPSEAIECGVASYYADSLAGRQTASGAIYQPDKRTAAHKTIAFGSVLRVVREDTGAETTVVINDRGPFTPNRVIDLSRVAAEDIDLIRAGVAQVCLYPQLTD